MSFTPDRAVSHDNEGNITGWYDNVFNGERPEQALPLGQGKYGELSTSAEYVERFPDQPDPRTLSFGELVELIKNEDEEE